MTRPGQKPKRTTPVDWSPEIAYFVGLVTSDGCLSKDGRHIAIVSKDKDLLDQVKYKLGFVGEVRPHNSSQFNSLAWRIQIGDVVLYRWLINIGLMPKKSKRLTTLKIPDKFFAHFLRGLFDGDGSIYSYWDKRYPDSFMYYVTFASGSRLFLDWLQDNIYKIYGLSTGRSRRGKKVWILSFSKCKARKLLYRIYDNSTIALQRKVVKAFKILENDPQVFADAFGKA